MEENNIEKKSNSLTKFQLKFIYFCIYSFFGWLMETLYVSSLKGHLVQRGFLFGPICPIYGFGAVMLITIFGRYKKHPGRLFFLAIILFTLFEYIVSFALESLYGKLWWDYSTHLYNINGRITLLSSFVWGILALLFLNTIHPYLETKLNKVMNKIPYITQNIIVNLIFTVYIIDTIVSCISNVFSTVNYL